LKNDDLPKKFFYEIFFPERDRRQKKKKKMAKASRVMRFPTESSVGLAGHEIIESFGEEANPAENVVPSLLMECVKRSGAYWKLRMVISVVSRFRDLSQVNESFEKMLKEAEIPIFACNKDRIMLDRVYVGFVDTEAKTIRGCSNADVLFWIPNAPILPIPWDDPAVEHVIEPATHMGDNVLFACLRTDDRVQLVDLKNLLKSNKRGELTVGEWAENFF
jgi:hypothetical protein